MNALCPILPQRCAVCGTHSWPRRRGGPGGPGGSVEQPGGDERWRAASSELGGLRGLGPMQMGDPVQQRHPSAPALFTC